MESIGECSYRETQRFHPYKTLLRLDQGVDLTDLAVIVEEADRLDLFEGAGRLDQRTFVSNIVEDLHSWKLAVHTSDDRVDNSRIPSLV